MTDKMAWHQVTPIQKREIKHTTDREVSGSRACYAAKDWRRHKVHDFTVLQLMLSTMYHNLHFIISFHTFSHYKYRNTAITSENKCFYQKLYHYISPATQCPKHRVRLNQLPSPVVRTLISESDISWAVSNQNTSSALEHSLSRKSHNALQKTLSTDAHPVPLMKMT